ncbi:MAG TPA: ABC transporter permease [Balneolaceae bacterium]
MLQIIIYNFDIALDAIQQNKMRSLLTSLGIIFGVASVIAMLAIGQGAQQEVLQQMKLLGTNNIIVKSVQDQKEGEVQSEQAQAKKKSTPFSPGLTLADMRSIKKIVPKVKYVSPEVIYETSFIRSGRMRTGKLVGVNPGYFEINNFSFLSGSPFTKLQTKQKEPVCIIGYDIRTKFFAGVNPIGKRIKAGDLWLTVIGVLNERQLSTESIKSLGIRNYNLDIYIPITTALLRYKDRSVVTQQDIEESQQGSFVVFSGGGVIAGGGGNQGENGNIQQLDKLIVQVSNNKYSIVIADILQRMLKRRHNGVVDFEIVVPELLLQQERRTKQIFNIVLACIASISLIIGGIGIMNIMLASIVERYKEIGVRRAVGAEQRDIQLQFLTEALTLSISGGFLGVILGIAFSYIIEISAGVITVVTLWSIVLSFSVAMITGVIFGYFPALKAARKDPVEALHHE